MTRPEKRGALSKKVRAGVLATGIAVGSFVDVPRTPANDHDKKQNEVGVLTKIISDGRNRVYGYSADIIFSSDPVIDEKTANRLETPVTMIINRTNEKLSAAARSVHMYNQLRERLGAAYAEKHPFATQARADTRAAQDALTDFDTLVKDQKSILNRYRRVMHGAVTS